MADFEEKAQEQNISKQIEAVYIPETGEVISKEAKSDETVIVALCHPQGIIFRFNEGQKKIFIKGNAANLVGAPKGILPLGGFGLTEIPKSDWDLIKKTHGNMAIFKNGLIFAHEKKADVKAEADEKKGLRHGREPIIVEGKDKKSQTEPSTSV